MRKTELLIPAGSLDVLKTAVIYGADAVYIGGEAFGLRAKAKNFTNEEIKKGIVFAHEHGVKVYITANILAHNDDLEGVEAYFEELKEIRPDASAQIYENSTYVKDYTYLGTVASVDGRGYGGLEQKNKFSVGETIEVMKPDGRNIGVVVKGIYDEDGNPQESAPHAQQRIKVDLGIEMETYDILRRCES